MRDEIDGRIWVAHHEEFSKGIDNALAAVRETFERLTAIQFAAPWRKDTRRSPAG